jgi:hypothetical protein
MRLGFVASIAEDHVAVQVVAASVGCPFIADERSEPAGLIGLFRRLDGFLPGRAVEIAVWRVDERLGEFALGESDNDLNGRFGALAADDHVVPLPAGWVGHERGLAGEQVREEPHIVGVVRDDEEIERT